MNKISKQIKTLNIMIYFSIYIMIGLAGYSALNIIIYAEKPASDFAVKVATEDGFKGDYCLYIHGKNHALVNYNDYNKLDNNGRDNVKMCAILLEIESAIRAILILLLFLTMYQIIKNMDKEKAPDQIRNGSKIKIIAIELILIGILPELIKDMIAMVFFTDFSIHVPQTGILLVVLGVLLKVASPIWKKVIKEEVETFEKDWNAGI